MDRMLMDDCVPIRVFALKVVPRHLCAHWEIFPRELIKAYLSKVFSIKFFLKFIVLLRLLTASHSMLYQKSVLLFMKVLGIYYLVLMLLLLHNVLWKFLLSGEQMIKQKKLDCLLFEC